MSNHTSMRKPFMHKCILAIIIIAFLAILGITLKSVKGSEKKQKGNETNDAVATTSVPAVTGTATGIIKSIDTESSVIKITDLDTQLDTLYTYTGGTSFLSRYGSNLTISNVQPGEIVAITYDTSTNKLTECEATEDAWEYKEVTNWSIDKEKKTFSIGSTTFQYNDFFFVFDSNGEIDSNELSSKDMLTVKGMNGQVYSVIVTKGHGTLQLANYEDFVGGSIEVGYDIMDDVKEDQVMTLREGDYRVTVKKGSLEAVKYVHINSNELTTLDLSDYKTQAAEKGKVTFDITPDGATLLINNVETDYSSEITLEYGEYNVQVSCSGYETYSETLTVSKESETVYIELADSSLSKATATPSATESSDSTTTDSTTTTATPTATDTTTATATASATSSASSTLVTDTDHTITISGPTGASVYINDEYKGTVPVSFTKVIGTNIQCTLKMDGYSDKTYALTVSDDNSDVNWTFSQWW